MNGYLIDPFVQTVTPIEFHHLRDVSELIDLGDGTDTVRVNILGDRLMVDELGHSREEQQFFTFGTQWEIAGKALLFGRYHDGGTQSALASHEEVLISIAWGRR